MPSLTSLRKFQKERGIVIHHNPNKTGSNIKGTGKKKAAAAKRLMSSGAGVATALTTTNKTYGTGQSKVVQAINVPVSQVVNTGYEGQQIQIVNHNGATIGTVQGVLGNSSNIQTIQLQVVEAAPPPPPKITKVTKNLDDNWKFIQVTPDGQTTTYIQQK